MEVVHPNTSVFTYLDTRDWTAVWTQTGCAHLESGRTGRWEHQARHRQKDRQCRRADWSLRRSNTCCRSHRWGRRRPWCRTAPQAEGLSNNKNQIYYWPILGNGIFSDKCLLFSLHRSSVIDLNWINTELTSTLLSSLELLFNLTMFASIFFCLKQSVLY